MAQGLEFQCSYDSSVSPILISEKWVYGRRNCHKYICIGVPVQMDRKQAIFVTYTQK